MTGLGSQGIHKMVERAVSRSDVEDKRGKYSGSTVHPVITISREYGAQGAVIAGLVASELAFQYWDQDLVHEVSKNTTTPEIVLATLDEHKRRMVTETLSVIFAKSMITSTEYQRELSRVIGAIAQRGSAVIVGRGAQFILPSSVALRVRVVAPLANRVHGVALRQGIAPKEAQAKIEKADEERAAVARDGHNKDINLGQHYDLVLNTSTLSLSQCRDFIIQAYAARFAADTTDSSTADEPKKSGSLSQVCGAR